MMNDDLESVGVSTPEARELVQSLMAVVEILAGTDAKGPPQSDYCYKKFRIAIAQCNHEYNQHKDTVKHKACLDLARGNYDTCMNPGGN